MYQPNQSPITCFTRTQQEEHDLNDVHGDDEDGPDPDLTTRDASFRMLDNALDPAEITARFGIEPTRAFARGEPMPWRPQNRRHTGAWFLKSPLPETALLSDMIDGLLEHLEPHHDAVQEFLARGYYCSFFCGYFPGRPMGDLVQFSPELLGRIAALGVPLEIDMFPADEDDDA